MNLNNCTWKSILVPLFVLPTGACGPGSGGKEEAVVKPNIVLILADDMGYGDAGFNGGRDIPTPHMDQIARNGVVFTDGYVTSPQCAPSRAGLLSGIDQNRFGCDENFHIDRNGITPGIRLFGDYLQQAGYRTGISGKWHLGRMEGAHPLDRGFEWFFGLLVGGGNYYPQSGEESIPRIFDGRESALVTEYLTDVLTDQAIRFIDESRHDPFFLYLSYTAPHVPLQAPDEYVERFAHLAIEGEPGLRCGYTGNHISHPQQVYAAMVSSMDDNIGRVMEALRKHGLEDNTMVIFLSDNGGPAYAGFSNNAPFRGYKGDVLEGGIRVPFALQWKSVIPGGQRISMPVSSLDLLPTALAAAGIDVPDDVTLDGIDLLPVLTGEKNPEPRTLTWRFPFPPPRPDLYVWAVRQGDWKLVRESERKEGEGSWGRNHVGLYRLNEDKPEMNDLSDSYAGKRSELQSIYDLWNAGLPVPSTEGRPPRN